MRSQTVLQGPGHGVQRAGLQLHIFESVYQTLFLDNLKLRNFLITVKNETEIGALSGYIVLYTCVRPLLCSFYCDGQCEGLKLWDGQKDKDLTFSYSNHLSAKVEDPAATKFNHNDAQVTQNTLGRIGNFDFIDKLFYMQKEER